jgi:DNA phosphorothioation-dependent restriction protein DptG
MTGSFLDDLRAAYLPSGAFKHVTPTRIRLFPHTTSTPGEKSCAELADFTGVLGECYRHLAQRELSSPCTPDQVLESAKTRVDSGMSHHLSDIIRKTAFSAQKLHFFNPNALPYLTFGKHEKVLDTFSQFVGDVVLEGDLSLLRGKEMRAAGRNNALVSLVIDSLPELRAQQETPKGSFARLPIGLDGVIRKDLCFLQRHPDLYAKWLPEVTKFYAFQYEARALEHLNAFFSDVPEREFFFSLEWESLSKGRRGYQGGWRRIDQKLTTLFSHANCLEMLSYVPFAGIDFPLTYRDIGDWTQSASPEQHRAACKALDGLIPFYKEAVTDVDWSRHEKGLRSACTEDDKVLNKVRLFFQMVHLQFMEKRKEPAGRYARWFRQLSIDSFLKRRGRIGYTLSLRRDQLLMLTRLCIADEERLCVRDLWKALRDRGVAFDSETRKHAVSLFDSLNILEKKSDSGDAQYVRPCF